MGKIQALLFFKKKKKHSKADTDIILNEKDNIIFENKEIAYIFNEYFGSIVVSLDLHIWAKVSANALMVSITF